MLQWTSYSLGLTIGKEFFKLLGTDQRTAVCPEAYLLRGAFLTLR